MVLYWTKADGSREDFMTWEGSLRQVRKQAKRFARNKLFHSINPESVRIEIWDGGLFGDKLDSVDIVRW